MLKRKIVLAIIVAGVLLAAVSKIYAISESAGGFAIWNQKEAYFIIHIDRRGDSSSYLLFPWILFKQYVIGGFAGAVIPSDTRAFEVVLHVTAAGVERRVLKLEDRANGGAGSDPKKFTPIEANIYAMCPGLLLCRWTGDNFENVTRGEQERLGGIDRLTDGDFDDANGWSRRVFLAGPADRMFTMNVGNQFSLVVNNIGGGAGTMNGTVSINLQRLGRVSERIASFDTREGEVGRAEYWHAFHDPE